MQRVTIWQMIREHEFTQKFSPAIHGHLWSVFTKAQRGNDWVNVQYEPTKNPDEILRRVKVDMESRIESAKHWETPGMREDCQAIIDELHTPLAKEFAGYVVEMEEYAEGLREKYVSENVHQVKQMAHKPCTDRQRAYLEVLGGKFTIGMSSWEASKAIEALKQNA